jgi:hypothetical protein
VTISGYEQANRTPCFVKDSSSSIETFPAGSVGSVTDDRWRIDFGGRHHEHATAALVPCRGIITISVNTLHEYGYGGDGPSSAGGGPRMSSATPVIRTQFPRRRAAGLFRRISRGVNPPGTAQRPGDAQTGAGPQKPAISTAYSSRRHVLMEDTGLPEHCPPASSLDARSRFPSVSGQGLPQATTGLTQPTTGTLWLSVVVSTSASLRGRKS